MIYLVISFATIPITATLLLTLNLNKKFCDEFKKNFFRSKGTYKNRKSMEVYFSNARRKSSGSIRINLVKNRNSTIKIVFESHMNIN